MIRDNAFDDESTGFDGVSDFRDFKSTFKFKKERGYSADGNGYTLIKDPESSGALTANTNAFLFGTTAMSVNDESVNLYDAFIVEFDLSAKNSFFDGMYISIFDNRNGKYPNLGWTILDNGTWYYANASTLEAATAKVALPENIEEWTHFTLIAYDDANGARIDTYINGEYFDTKTDANNLKKNFRMERICIRFNKDYAYGPEFGREIRFDNFYSAGYGSASEPSVADNVFGLDDYIELGDNTLPLTFVEDIKFNHTYEFESPNTKNVTLGNGDHYNLAAAFKALENGDTVTLTKDLTLYTTLDESIKTLTFTGANVTLIGDATKIYSLDGGVLTKNESYKASWTDGTSTVYTEELALDKAPDPSAISAYFGIEGDHKDASKWYISMGGAEKVLLSEFDWSNVEANSEVILSPRYGTVSWYELDGETLNLENEKWFIGSEIEPRGFDTLEALESLDNGWYEWGYDSWAALDGSAADFTGLTEGAHMDFVATKTIVSSIDVKFNCTLGSLYRASIYLPEELPEVKVTEVNYAQASKQGSSYVAGKFSVVEGAPAIIGGERYTRYLSDALSIYSWYPKSRFVVSFDVTIGDGDAAKTYSVTSKDIDFGLPDYLNTVLNTYDCGSPEETLVLNWVQYINTQYAVSTNSTGLNPAIALLDKHDATCKGNNLYALDAQIPTSPDTSLTYKTVADTLGDGFAANYAILSSSIRAAFYVPKAYADAHPDLKIQIALVGIKNGLKNQNITFDLFCQTEDVETEVEGETVVTTVKSEFTVNGTKCYRFIADGDAMSMYNANEIMTISIIPGGEEETVSVTYSIAEYLYNINAKLTPESSGSEVRSVENVKALIAFAKASKEYTSYSIDNNAQ